MIRYTFLFLIIFAFTMQSCNEYANYEIDNIELSIDLKSVELQKQPLSLFAILDVKYNVALNDVQIGLSYASHKEDVKNASYVSWIQHIGYPHYELYVDNVVLEDPQYIAALAVVNKHDTIWSDILSADIIQKEYGDSTLNGHRFVDLGLPSGTLWADCNIGASGKYESGDYFAWGETQPKEDNSWETYKYCNGAEDKLTKYNYSTMYGENPDHITVLEDIDDAANIIWGKGWRIPSPEQYQELMDYCNYFRTVQGKIEGFRFIGTNGNEIYLPGEGINEGEYWTNSIYFNKHTYLTHPERAFVWSQWSTSQRIRQVDRCNLKLIRPVCK